MANDTASGTVSEFAPGNIAPSATLIGLSYPQALAFDGSGDLYVANQGNGTVSEFAWGSTTLTATLTGLSSPEGLVFDTNGDLYVSNRGNATVREFAPGAATPTATLSGLNGPGAMAVDAGGDLYVANTGGNTVSEFVSGSSTPSVTFTGLHDPRALAFDAGGKLCVANGTASGTVSKFIPETIVPTAGGVVIRPSLPTCPMSLGGANDFVDPADSPEQRRIVIDSAAADRSVERNRQRVDRPDGRQSLCRRDVLETFAHVQLDAAGDNIHALRAGFAQRRIDALAAMRRGDHRFQQHHDSGLSRRQRQQRLLLDKPLHCADLLRGVACAGRPVATLLSRAGVCGVRPHPRPMDAVADSHQRHARLGLAGHAVVARRQIDDQPDGGRRRDAQSLHRPARHQRPRRPVPIIFTLDDNEASGVTDYLPIFQKYGLHAVMGVNMGRVAGQEGGLFATLDQLRAWQAAGMELCSHGSYDHEPVGYYNLYPETYVFDTLSRRSARHDGSRPWRHAVHDRQRRRHRLHRSLRHADSSNNSASRCTSASGRRAVAGPGAPTRAGAVRAGSTRPTAPITRDEPR